MNQKPLVLIRCLQLPVASGKEVRGRAGRRVLYRSLQTGFGLFLAAGGILPARLLAFLAI